MILYKANTCKGMRMKRFLFYESVLEKIYIYIYYLYFVQDADRETAFSRPGRKC